MSDARRGAAGGAERARQGPPAAKEVGELAYLLRFGLYAHAAAVEIARDPRALGVAPTPAANGEPPYGVVLCKDGTPRGFDLRYVVDLMRSDQGLRDEMDRAWCVSSLILLGDQLAAANYFDRAPVLEIVRHLRNGIAHGNRFTLRNPSELSAWPASMRDAAHQSGNAFDITPDLDGSRVLFDFVGPGDVLDVLISVGTHLLSLDTEVGVRRSVRESATDHETRTPQQSLDQHW